MESVTKPKRRRPRCQWCKQAFTPKSGGLGRRQLYCKPGCRQRAYEKRKWTPVAATDALALDLLPWATKRRLVEEVRHQHMGDLLKSGVVPLLDPAQIDGFLDQVKPPEERRRVLNQIEDACRKRADDTALGGLC